MKKGRYNLKIIFCIGAILFFLVTIFLPSGLSNFILPEVGGGMIHCDPQMSDNIRRLVPTTNVNRVWYSNDLGGELFGTWGNGIASNGKIAAGLFNNYFGRNNLIIYDYYGNRIWSDNEILNFFATASTPMVDIYDKIIACDNRHIILVDASNRTNITVKWNSTIRYYNEIGFYPIPFSPTILEKNTVILPTKKGPLLAYNVTTGAKIADIKLGKDGINESYYGIPDMSETDFLSIISNPKSCPYHYNSQSHTVEWASNIAYGMMPSNYIFQEDNIVFINSPDGNILAYDDTTGEVVASNPVADPQLLFGNDYYSTINSALVKDNMIYLACEKEGNNIGQLFAVKVFPNASNESEVFQVEWNYSYFGKSQATPTIIGDTVYFDGYNSSFLSTEPRDPHIYAVYTNGTEKWKISYPNMTWFSFAKDPRGGFWYEDSDPVQLGNNTGGNKLVHFSEQNGSIIEEIDMKTLLNDNGPNQELPVIPSSCMTTCGTSENPIMLISANHQWRNNGKWVIAINLSDNNSVLWKVSLPLFLRLNYANGQYTILTENNQSRVLFETWLGGVMALGSLSNCSFQDIDYYLKDSPGDDNSYDDTVQMNYTIKTSLPDRVLVKATLISVQHPILCRYKVKEYYNISSPANITDSLNITLPPRAPMGEYILRVFLYNSSGEADRDLIHLFDYLDFGIFANDTYSVGPFFLYPPNDPPEPPHQPWGEEQVLTSEKNTYTTHTTDPNGDSIWYQWKYETNIGLGRFTYYTRWIMGLPKVSGENITKEIQWPFAGTYNVWVRAKDNILNPNVMSDWSPAKQVTVTKSDDGASWNLDLFNTFTSSMIAINQQTSCDGLVEGIIVENAKRGSLNWTWEFGDGNISYGENVSHSYSRKGNYDVNLTLKNPDGITANYTTIISVDVLKADFNITGDKQPDKAVNFNDTSCGNYQLVNWSWDFDDGNESYERNISHVYADAGEYNVTLTVKDIEDNIYEYTKLVYIESLAPDFISVIDDPDPVGYGNNVTIYVDFFDNQSGVEAVMVNITNPDNTTSGNFTMEQNMSSEHDYLYVYNDTWQNGVYNYSIWVVDNANNTNCTTGFNFTVSAEANITITTTKNTYTGNEYINLTDPPGDPSPSIGYELLDDGSVLHLWNQYDSYYFNTSCGIQLTNHYNNYWSQNVLMLGYYNNDQWNLIYRNDELTGFMKSIETDNASFVNVTLWKDLTYNGYTFRLAIRYHLGIDDRELTVIPYIKNLGAPIPYTLGFAWEINDIQVAMTPENDYLEINGTRFPLNESTDVTYRHLADPAFSITEILPDDVLESLSLRWSESLNYLVWVKTRAGEYNAPVILGIKIGTLNTGQEKFTELLWHDASQMTYYFNHHDRTDIWATNPDNMVDGNLSKYASTTIQNDVELCDTNTCNGTSLGTISKVELRVYGYCSSGHRDIILQPVFNGHDHGNNYSYSPSSTPSWSSWYNITSDPGRQIFGTWNWSEIRNLDCDVSSQYIQFGGAFNLLCSKIELRVTYNNAPVITNPVPPHGSNGIALLPWLNITVADPNGDMMNVTWYSNSTPSFLTLRPNANGSTTQLERYPSSQNANYKCVDETTTNDSDYVKWKGTSWKKDTYNLPNHSSQAGTIHDVIVYARCARVGSVTTPTTTSSAKIVIRSGGVDYYGSEFKPPHSMWPPISYTNYAYSWKNNPATGNAWSWTDIDNLQAGITFIGNEGTSECTQLYVVVNYTNPNTWLQFGRNSSVNNGTHRQRFLNASMNGQWWYWKVNADDGTLSTWSSVYKFYTGYQSKIENCGDTNFSGYLLIQIQFYNTSQGIWLVDNDTINETISRTITSGSQLGLDTIFNGLVRASDLTYGAGTYRVYAAFRDPEGNILRTNDDVDLETWWQFSKT